MRDKLFSAICSRLEKHNNEDYRCKEITNLEIAYDATIYTLDAKDMRDAANEIIDLIGDFFIKGISLTNKGDEE